MNERISGQKRNKVVDSLTDHVVGVKDDGIGTLRNEEVRDDIQVGGEIQVTEDVELPSINIVDQLQVNPNTENLSQQNPVQERDTSLDQGSTHTKVSVAKPETVLADSPNQAEISSNLEINPNSFFAFTGRTSVWGESLMMLTKSPWVGFGFHADRLLFNTHAHNALVHSLLQAGLLGGILFASSLILGWLILIKNIFKSNRLLPTHMDGLILAAGVLTFLSVRAFPESTGAFFGIDWLILAPIYVYLEIVRKHLKLAEQSDVIS